MVETMTSLESIVERFLEYLILLGKVGMGLGLAAMLLVVPPMSFFIWGMNYFMGAIGHWLLDGPGLSKGLATAIWPYVPIGYGVVFGVVLAGFIFYLVVSQLWHKIVVRL